MHDRNPTLSELQALTEIRAEPAVSISLATTPETENIQPRRTGLRKLLELAIEQLAAVGRPKRSIWPIEDQIADLADDDDFWAFQSNAPAIFVTAGNLRSYRLPNHLTERVQGSDRFHVKPMYRAVTATQHAFVLALEENAVRLIEVSPDMPAREPRVPASGGGIAALRRDDIPQGEALAVIPRYAI